MDILVSQLNRRLALQLPAELPLGLIFVAGTVAQLYEERKPGGDNGRSTDTVFDLEQAEHRLRCKLSRREAERIIIRQGDEVRLGGHLAFDPLRAEYYLLARDAEVIGSPSLDSDPLAIDLDELVEDQASFTAALTGIKRRSDVARQTSTSLPEWVHKIAPLELQEVEAPPPVSPAAKTTTTPLSEELVTYLAAAMESDQDVEITPEMLAQWVPASKPAPAVVEETPVPSSAQTDLPEQTASLAVESEIKAEPMPTVRPYDPVGDPTIAAAPPPTLGATTPPKPHRTDWLVIVLIAAMGVFTCALLVTAVLSALN